MATPFREIINNVSDLKIKARGDSLKVYKGLITNVFNRLDKYFVDNGFYEFNDYNVLNDFLLNKKGNEFKVETKISPNTKGTFNVLKDRTSYVSLNIYNFMPGVETEGYLCHEIVHLLSSGMSVIQYKNDKGQKIEVSVADNINQKAGYKKTYDNGGNKTEVLPDSGLRKGVFLKEGLTESFKQEIYSNSESRFCYPIETRFINFLNFVCNIPKRDAYKDFLQGDLVTYKKILTKDKFYYIEEELDKFMNEYRIYNRVYDNPHYLNVEKMLISVGFKEFSKTNPSIKDFTQYCDKFVDNVNGVTKEEFIEESSKYALKILLNICNVNSKTPNYKSIRTNILNEYEKLIKTKFNQKWYSNYNYSSRGFKFDDLGLEIYYKLNNNSNPAGYFQGMDLSYHLLPKSNITSIGNSSNNEGINICNMGQNRYKYYNSKMERIVEFDGTNCKIFDGNNKLIDSGSLLSYKNEELKKEEYNEQKTTFEDVITNISNESKSGIDDDNIQ